MHNIYLVPRQLGAKGTQKGYLYLVDSLKIALENEESLAVFTQIIFPEVARRYDTTVAHVERNIRTIVDQCWNSSFREKLQEITPYRLEKKPSVGEFIDIVYWHIRVLEEQNTPS